MAQLGEILRFELQARIELERGARTIFELLRERMDGVDRTIRRKSLKERLGLNGIACCGATWGLGPTTTSVMDDDEEEEGPIGPLTEVTNINPIPIENRPILPCVGQSPVSTGINLAAALAAERQFRASLDSENGGSVDSQSPSPSSSTNFPRPNGNEERSPLIGPSGIVPGTPLRVSLIRLLEETDGCDGVTKKDEEGSRCDTVCCVCMGRKKGAAFIPCGHTFCRVCSREVWLNRGSCPLCNRLILEILDIY